MAPRARRGRGGMDEPVLHMEGRLSVCEEETAFLVVREEDPDDWLPLRERRTLPSTRLGRELGQRLQQTPRLPLPQTSDASCQLPSRALGPAAIHSSLKRMSERIRE